MRGSVRVPCRALDGRVWSYQVTSDGEWVATRHEIGDDGPRPARSAEEPKSLDCNPATVTRRDLDLLENGVVETVVLAGKDGTWSFVLHDELRGVFTYRYRFLDSRIVPEGATRKMVTLPAYGAFCVIAFGGLAILIRRALGG